MPWGPKHTTKLTSLHLPAAGMPVLAHASRSNWRTCESVRPEAWCPNVADAKAEKVNSLRERLETLDSLDIRFILFPVLAIRLIIRD